jgi:hypothetical protein
MCGAGLGGYCAYSAGMRKSMASDIRGVAVTVDGGKRTHMMDDHYTISAIRNSLSDALKALLKAGIMDKADFSASRGHASVAIELLNVLLRESDRDAP